MNMTYVVATNMNGFSCIVSDTRVTFKEDGIEWGDNTNLKTGFLFPGCIFGRAGNDARCRDFISTAKLALIGERSLEGFWNRFEQFVSTYEFPVARTDQFELLIANRASGQTQLYQLDCKQGLVPNAESVVTIGSGKDLLDPFVLDSGIHLMHQIVTENHLPPAAAPYTLCLLLTEFTQGLERPAFEKARVGGVFHFRIQSANGEESQRPALYILVSLDVQKKIPYAWMYRTSFSQGALVVESMTPPPKSTDAPDGWKQTIALREASGTSYSQEELVILRESIWEDLKAQPSYWFCGFGAIDPNHRNSRLIHIARNGDWIVGKDGTIAPEYGDLIVANFVQNIRDEH